MKPMKRRWIETPVRRADAPGDCSLARVLGADFCDGVVCVGDDVRVGDDGSVAHFRCVEEAFYRANNSFELDGFCARSHKETT